MGVKQRTCQVKAVIVCHLPREASSAFSHRGVPPYAYRSNKIKAREIIEGMRSLGGACNAIRPYGTV